MEEAGANVFLLGIALAVLCEHVALPLWRGTKEPMPKKQSMNITDPESIKPDLSLIIDAHIAGTHGVLADGCKDFRPKLIVQAIDPFSGDDKPQFIAIIILDDFNEPEEKHGIMEKLGREFYDRQKLPVSVSLASEAWLSGNQEGIRPSEADDRREVIIVFALGIDGTTDMQMMPFKRDKKGNIIEGPFIRYSGGIAACDLLEYFYAGFWGEYEKKEKGMRR